MLLDLITYPLGLLSGAVIGYSFGLLQAAALRHNEKLQQSGKLKSGWSIMPGSGGRVALLLFVLALIQVICPLLFRAGTQWWVSGGVVLGYGWTLLRQLLQRRSEAKA